MKTIIAFVIGIAVIVLALSGLEHLGIAQAQSGSGSATVVVPSADNVLGDPVGAIGQIEALFRGGTLLGAAALLVYVLLVFAAKLDTKRAFYWTFGVSVAGVLAEGFANGHTPNIGMLVGLVVPFVMLLMKGPEFKKQE